jgi:chromosome segregation ATPase
MTISVDSGTQGGPGDPGSLLNGMSLTPTGSIASGATGQFGGSGIPLFQNTGQTTVNQKFGSRALPKAPVQTNDVSLSARSFNERLLVGMRDISISVGQEQIRMLSKQNSQLRRNLNEVEQEMIVLQTELTNKDNTITKKERELEEIQRECAQLIGEMQKAEGRENAMNLASKQNTHLLRLLEMEEAKRDTLTDDRDSLNMQLNVVRDAHSNLTKEAAENEAKLKENMKRIRQKAFDKSREAELNQTKAMQLQANLAETERIAKFEISSMKDELMNKRDKVYQLLDKLQVTEDKLRRQEDLAEKQQEMLEGR